MIVFFFRPNLKSEQKMISFQCPDNYFLLEIWRTVHASTFGEFLGKENNMYVSPRLVIEYGNSFIELPSKENFFGDLVFSSCFTFSSNYIFFSFPPILY